MPEIGHHEFWQELESSQRNYEKVYAALRWLRGWGLDQG